MIVDNLDVVGTFIPSEADPPLLVDANRVLAFPIANERFETTAGRHSEVIQARCRSDKLKLPSRRLLDRMKPANSLVLE